jgi:hypothetical protein
MALAKSMTSTCTGELPLLRTGYAILYGIDCVIGFAIGRTIEKVKMLSLNVLLHWVCAIGYTIVIVFGYMDSYALTASFSMPFSMPLAIPLAIPLSMPLAIPWAMPSAMPSAMP